MTNSRSDERRDVWDTKMPTALAAHILLVTEDVADIVAEVEKTQ